VSEAAAGAGAGGAGITGGLAYHRDPQETWLALTVLGSVLTAVMSAELAWPDAGWLAGNLGSWLAALTLTLAFGALWLTFRWRAAAAGLRYRAGFGMAAIVGLIFCFSPLALAMVYAGPFLVFGLGLLAAAIRTANYTLAIWALAAGGTGVAEGFFGITNRLPVRLWASWEHPAIFLALGVLIAVAGVGIRLAGRRR
jgi:hypothetical protein